jgi:hypothetical protein
MQQLAATTARTSRTARLAIAAMLAVISLLAVAGTASADEFSPFTTSSGWPSRANTPLTWHYTFDGCAITVGPIKDPLYGFTTFRTVGGAQVTCPTGGHTISITVREWAWNGASATSPWAVGNTAGLTLRNSAGFLAETIVGCVGHSYFWTTGTYVTIDGYNSGWLYSPWSDWKTAGC